MDEKDRKHWGSRELAAMDKAEAAGGVLMSDLSDGDEVVVTSSGHLYHIKILSAEMRKVEVWSDDPAFKVPVEAHLSGSLFHPAGTMLQSGWIRIGGYIELTVKPRREGELPGTLTMPMAERVSVNGIEIAAGKPM